MINIDKNKYQVFVMGSPCNLPAFFATHTWFVVNERGVVSRWEGRFKRNTKNIGWDYVHKDFLPPFQGLGILYGFNQVSWPSRLITTIEGDKDSKAAKLIKVIKSSPQRYPKNIVPRWTGPNSNTYIRYLLNQVPGLNVKLPTSAIGKGYNFPK